MATSTPMFKIEHIPELWAPRQAFNDAYVNSQGDFCVQQACEMRMIPENIDEYDLGLLLKQGLPEQVRGGRVDFGAVKEYENKWSLTEWAWTLDLTESQVRHMDTRGLDFMAHVRDAGRKHLTRASRTFGKVIRGAAGESGYKEIVSKIDDASSTVLLFGDGSAATHILNGTSDTNWRSSDPVTSSDTIAEAYASLTSAIDEWENLPDSDGIAGGAGNDFLTNGMVLCSTDIYSLLRSVLKRQTITTDYDNIWYDGFRLVKVSGMADDSLVITRDPQKSAIPGFYWVVSPRPRVDYSPPGDPAGYLTHRWVSTYADAIVPTSWQYSLLLK